MKVGIFIPRFELNERMDFRVLGIIPARGGSKRIPDKTSDSSVTIRSSHTRYSKQRRYQISQTLSSPQTTKRLLKSPNHTVVPSRFFDHRNWHEIIRGALASSPTPWSGASVNGGHNMTQLYYCNRRLHSVKLQISIKQSTDCFTPTP
jgi:hypothetical protein